MPRPRPTYAQIHEVRQVLYDEPRRRDIEGELESVDGTMNTRFAEHRLTLTCPHQSCTVGVSPTEGAKHADNVAQLLFEIAGDLARLRHIDAADKADLIAGVDALAKSWQARATAWRAAARGAGDLDALVNAISAQYRKSTDAFSRVPEYLR